MVLMKSKLTNNFHSMRLDFAEPSGDSLRVGLTYNGSRISGKFRKSNEGIVRKLADAINKFIEKRDGQNYGQKMTALDMAATRARSFAELESAVRSL